jgi:hypothetical protein
MIAALPLGSVRLRTRRGLPIAFIKVTHHGPQCKRWVRLSRVAAARHFGPLPSGAIVAQKDGDPLNVNPENLEVRQSVDILSSALSANPALEARRRVNQSRIASRQAKTRNKLRARIDRSISIRRGQYYAVSHDTQMIIFVPCRTKHQAERYGQQAAYRHLEVVAVRGARLETECAGYRREIPDEGQAWSWRERKSTVAPPA